MNIKPIDNVNFGIKVKTTHLLELTTLAIFEPDGFLGMTNTMKEIFPLPKHTGINGYRRFAKLVGNKLVLKYSQIADATQQIKAFMRNNPKASVTEIQVYARSLASHIGETIDVVL